MRHFRLAWGGAACVLLLPLSARAGDAALAEALFRDGKTAMEAGDYAQGCPKLAASYREDPGTGTLLALALCYEQAGKLASAWATYGQAAARAHAESSAERERVARERVTALEPRLSRLSIVVPAEVAELPGVSVKRDGEPLPAAAWGSAAPVDPGTHLLEVTAEAHAPWTQTVEVGPDGAREVVTVGMPPNAPAVADATPTPAAPATSGAAPGNTRQTLAWVSLGVGAVGVATGSVFGAVSISQHQRAKEQCPSTCDSQHGSELWHSATVTGNVSTVAFIVGGVGLAAGAVLWFTKPAPTRGVALGVGPSSVVVRGAW